jgi:Ca-activated chloride channel family protein
MLKFERIEILYVLGIIPVLIVIFMIVARIKRKSLDNFASADMRNFLIPMASSFKPVLKFVILLTGLTFLIIGLAGPRVGSKLKEVTKKGREIIIALDVSNSMLAEDVKPNRLMMAKQSLNRLLNELENDKIGLIVFAGDAYTQVPITNDYGAARLFLNSVSTEMVSRQGTALGAAIELASKSFSPESQAENTSSGKSRAIIVITDGENHEDDAFEAAKAAADKGIVIHAIGLGDPDGVPIPLYPGSRDVRRDKEGNVVVSKLDETSLKKIASVSGGFYYPAKNTAGLQQLLQKLNEIETEEYTARVFAEYIERYQYMVGIGLFLLILESLILLRKNTWLDRLNLFE